MEEQMTKLARIAEMSSIQPNMVFTSIAHLIDDDLLKQCHQKMEKDKAVGIDGVSKEDYEKEFDGNVKDLVRRIRTRSYKPKPARRIEIPKENGKMRPLNIYCYEDKLVQAAIKEMLEAVFEPMFYNEMMGFRPHRNCHMALGLLNHMIEKERTNYVLDADIKGFFDHLNHEYCIKFIESRIKDPRFTRLIRVMLKAGIMEGFDFEESEEGSGQGSVCSPTIANIYMHYVLLWWFKEKVQPTLRGFAGIVVYADDFVVTFQHKNEAEGFYNRLKHRMGYFGLQMEEEKTRLIEFGRFAEQNSQMRQGKAAETFTFLGFTHYCSTSKGGWFRVKRKTSRKKFSKKCREMNREICLRRDFPIKDLIKWINQVLTGYYNYYAITDNSEALNRFYQRILKLLFKWLNRRSQRSSMTYEQFNSMLKRYPVCVPKIKVDIYKIKYAI